MDSTNTFKYKLVLEEDGEQIPEQNKKKETANEEKELPTEQGNEKESKKQEKEILPPTDQKGCDLPSKKEVEKTLTAQTAVEEENQFTLEQDKAKQKAPIEKFLRATASDMYIVKDEDTVTTIINRHLSYAHVAPDCEEYWSFNKMIYGRNLYPLDEEAKADDLPKNKTKTSKAKSSVFTTNINVSRMVCDESGKKSNEFNCAYKGTTIRIDEKERNRPYAEYKSSIAIISYRLSFFLICYLNIQSYYQINETKLGKTIGILITRSDFRIILVAFYLA